MKGNLTDRDHNQMDEFFRKLIDEVVAGRLARETAVGTLSHVVAAVDIGNHQEARKWFSEPDRLITELKKNSLKGI